LNGALQENVATAGGGTTIASAGQAIEAVSTMNERSFAYSPWKFFQVIFAVAWSAFAHPFSTTVIDLETGRAYERSEE
jgi:hypothetical protein